MKKTRIVKGKPYDRLYPKGNKKSNNAGGSLCSGYKIFPDGSACKGCIDCEFGKLDMSMEEVFNKNHSTVVVTKGMSGDDIMEIIVNGVKG